MRKTLKEMSDEQLISSYKSDMDLLLSELALRYMPLILHKARGISESDAEDMAQEGLIGLFYAIRSFDSSHNTLFKTYATHCITNKMLSALRAQKQKNGATLSIDEESFNEILLSVESDHNDPQELFIKMEDYNNKLGSINEILTEFERDVLGLYLEGLSYREIAAKLDCSEKSVDNALQRMKKKLKKN